MLRSLRILCALPMLLALALVPASAQAPARRLTVAAAADLKFALEAIKVEFAKAQPGIALNVIYGSSGNFYAQIANQAPFDVFLSADMEYPQKLAQQGLTVKGSEFLYAVGRLAIWVPNDSKIDVARLGIKSLLDPSIKKISIGNPAHAPYGKAAEAAMKSLGVFDQAQPKLVFGENIAQAAQYVESGAAEIGIIALSLAQAPEMASKGRSWEVPLSAYPRMDQGGVILASTKDPGAAQAFRSFMIGSKGHEILRKYGFSLPATK